MGTSLLRPTELLRPSFGPRHQPRVAKPCTFHARARSSTAGFVRLDYVRNNAYEAMRTTKRTGPRNGGS